MKAWRGDIEAMAVRNLKLKKKKIPLAFGWKIFPIRHMDNDIQLIQHRIISFFFLCANLMDISNKLAKHNNKYK